MAIALLAGFAFPASAQVTDAAAPAVAQIEQALVQAIERSERSVVSILRVRKQDAPMGVRAGPFNAFDRRNVLPAEPAPPENASGDFGEYATGVIVDARGLILTNYHVIDAGSDEHQYFVTTSERLTFPAQVLAADPRSDLAVLELEPAPKSPLPVIALGDASALKKGQIVIALGNPYSIARDGQASASWGIVSNLGRKFGPNPTVSAEQTTRPTLYHVGSLIQTDARLNLGTSGGALLNLQGEMVGLTTSLAALSGYEQAAGYAIPVDESFRRILALLVEGREVEYGFLGVEPRSLSLEEQTQGLRGAIINTVYPGTPAVRAGLQPNDLVTSVDGQPVYDADSLILNVGRLPVEAQVRLNVIRRGQEMQREVELAKFLVVGRQRFKQQPEAWRGIRVDYQTVDPSFRERVQIDLDFAQGGVLVTEVADPSTAAQKGLRRGMLITHVGGVRVHTPREFRAAVSGETGSVDLRLWGEAGQTQEITIEPETG
jgi:S1-C subfamily serine protease